MIEFTFKGAGTYRSRPAGYAVSREESDLEA